MNNIYTTFLEDTYVLSESHQTLILDSIVSEFDVNYEIKNGYTVFNFNGGQYRYGRGLWIGNPPMSNIKYVVDQLAPNFIGSKTDNLCRFLHNAYVHAAEAKLISIYANDQR